MSENHDKTAVPNSLEESFKVIEAQSPDWIESLHHLFWTIPEVNHWFFSFYEILLPALLAKTRSINIPALKTVDYAWSTIDGLSSIVIGITQLLDTKTHRPIVMKTKGTINVSSGLQLFLLNLLLQSAVPLAFVIATSIDLTLSLETLLHAFRKRFFTEYWINDQTELYEKRRADLIQITEEIKKLKEEEDTTSHQKVLIELYKTRQQKIEQEMSHITSNLLFYRRALIANEDSEIQPENEGLNQQEIYFEPQVLEKLDQELMQAGMETGLFALIVVGWVLFLLLENQPPTLAIIAFTAGCYFLKNSVEFYRMIYPIESEEPILSSTP